jgi:hypothetical protein
MMSGQRHVCVRTTISCAPRFDSCQTREKCPIIVGFGSLADTQKIPTDAVLVGVACFGAMTLLMGHALPSAAIHLLESRREFR